MKKREEKKIEDLMNADALKLNASPFLYCLIFFFLSNPFQRIVKWNKRNWLQC